MIKILIVDDHTLFREGMQAILTAGGGAGGDAGGSTAADYQVVGNAIDGEEAIRQVNALMPDIVLLDIQMPKLNGIDAARAILRAHPHIGIIMLTMLEDDASVFAAIRAGARGYILKGADKAEVLKTIRAVAAGEALFGPAIAQRISRFFAAGAAHTAQPFPDLTERERDILSLIAQGLNNAAIAERLVISPKTLSNHISNIFAKLQVADRAQAILKAKNAGL